MAITLLIAAAAAAQGVPATEIRVDVNRAEISAERIDVAYVELSSDRTVEAVAKLQSLPRQLRAEPAALINLGTAYARMGRRDEAETMYVKAIASRERYDLELADGTWVNSRAAARMALRLLADGHVLALR